MLLAIACVLFVLWLLGITVFKMTKGVIHIVLVIAIIVIIMHFVGVGR
jgi:hypothetical protein